MTVERIYEQQTGPEATQMLPGRDAREFGAGVGQALTQLGGQVHEQQVRAFQVDKKIEQDRQLSDWSHRYALHRDNLDGITRQMRSTGAPGGQGHSMRIREVNEAAREKLFEGITDPTVRRMAEQQWDSFSGQLYGQEGDWEEGQRVAKVVTDTSAANSISAGRIRRSSDPKVYASELQIMLDRNAALNVDPATRDKLNKNSMETAGVAYVQNLQDTNPAMAKAVLDSGEFDFLGPELVEGLRNGTDVEIRRREAAAEHAAAQQRAQEKENDAALEEANRQGLAVPDEELDKQIKAARDRGDDSQALKLEGIKAENRFARIYEGQPPVIREQRLTALKAKRNPTLDEQREIKWLEDKRGALDGRFNSDPVAWAIENGPPGSGPPPGDIGDAGVMRGRVAWSRRQATALGRPGFPLLTKAEQSQFDGLRSSGPGGELKVLQWMDGLPDDMARQQAAREIAPNDKTFQAMALVRPRPRATIRAGQQAMQANPAWWKPDKDHPGVAPMLSEVDGDLAVAMKAFAPTDAQAVQTIGRQFVAGAKSGAGKSVNQVDRNSYAMGIRVGLGGAVRNGRDVGGLGYWSSKPMVLPSEMVLEARLEVPGVRSFENAVGADMAARKVYPVNPDGSLAQWGYIHPVLVRVEQAGAKEMWIYRWEDRSGRVVKQNGGGDFISRIENR